MVSETGYETLPAASWYSAVGEKRIDLAYPVKTVSYSHTILPQWVAVRAHFTTLLQGPLSFRKVSVSYLLLGNEPAKIRLLVGPFKLEFDLLFVPLSFVLDVELGTSGHVDPFSGHLNLESLTRLEGIGQPAQLRYELGGGVDPLDVPVVLFAHRFSLGSKINPSVSYRIRRAEP
jgi:hypothetical protein